MSKNMSLEAALDEEMRDVMALLEGRTPPSSSSLQQRIGAGRAASPAGMAQSPVRSMLDIGPPPSATARHASIAGTAAAGVTQPVRSMLDPTSPPPPPRSMLHTTSPPPTPSHMGPSHTGLRASASPPPARPGSKLNPEEAYQFEMLPSNERNALPKRVTQGEGWKKPGKSAMGSIFGEPIGRTNSAWSRRSLSQNKSGSPAGLGRSASPATAASRLNTNSVNLKTSPGVYVSGTGQVIDMASAYRRLSDAALLKSGGRLADLPTKKGANPSRGTELAPDGSERLTTDFHDEDALESSEDEDDESLTDDDWRRGRGRTRKDSDTATSMEGKTPKSLLAAAEEERKSVSSSYKVRSLLDPDPTVTVTDPSGERLSPTSLNSMRNSRHGSIHPHTSFDAGGESGISTPMDSDDEDKRSDIESAARLALTLSPIHSSPGAHRCIRQVIRGDYRKYQLEAERGLRRQRMYLVATDLSEEAAYALEWTIGTVLRDGDTLLAVYAVDEESGMGTDGAGGSIAIGDGASVMRDAAAVVRTLSNEQGLTVPGIQGVASSAASTAGSEAPTVATATTVGTAPTISAASAADAWSARNSGEGVMENPGAAASTTSVVTDTKNMDKSERERYFATQEISDRCVKLLKRTKLQVRIVVEVFHCKSPKHMITEVIDYLEPTLVILGSRGRSALKGVLLGSFSNYLVTKSSVPVMVARKKLRKHSKLKHGNLRLSNMLPTPSSGRKLETANIEKPSKGLGKIGFGK
ncbi:adenine nucleotide alpha hydrolases-like protein [Trichodelitschia bisporula]|uniref:Adenine nucleotide alpha hydrolases-like protein n=1 Tax=Trichodelitschia bisporula TaxID=703511 RepID=A0A6G1HXD9_9PEZI|nr:adenine nucleotide alpha hydrolases-like protein [Trichodelitschia bisporula]